MTRQESLPFFECADEATDHAIKASGRQYKEVAHALWPALKLDTAYARLKACLNADKAEKLTSDEHMFIANFCGRYDWLYYHCSGCSHDRPSPISPADVAAQLQREFIESVARLERIQARLARAQGQ